MYLRRILLTSLIFAVVCLAADSVAADPITVTGTATGSIGGQPLNATVSGSLGGGSGGTGNITATFSSLPDDITPASVVIIITVQCQIITPASDEGCSQDIFSATGGNYTLNRTFTFDGFPASSLNVSASVMTVGTNLTSTAVFSGDLPVGGNSVLSYTQSVTPNGPGSILETGVAVLDSGQVIRWSGVFTYSGPALAAPYTMNINWNSITLSGTTLITDFDTQCVPEPTSMFLLGTGLAAFAAAVRKRKHR
ncbi:MAG: PEP-CTERM sorting domain-containing protein [Acidobacteria bacterium]|nr:PEP-CTERM sorting domain-containing protein [Acidobacteriota bacterium]